MLAYGEILARIEAALVGIVDFLLLPARDSQPWWGVTRRDLSVGRVPLNLRGLLALSAQLTLHVMCIEQCVTCDTRLDQ